MNPLSMTDFYKGVHWQQYPRNTRYTYSYLESRSTGTSTMFMGLSYQLQELFEERLHSISRVWVMDAKRRWARAMGANYFNENDFLRLQNGPLPLRIRAVPEGTMVPSGNVLLTVENTDPHYYWLTNFVESMLLQLWYPSTVATQAHEVYKVIRANLEETGTPDDARMKLHDFGVRACTCMEQAGIGGMAHLANFDSTDNVPAVEYIERYYNGIAGSSIPASEHSTMTSWGKHAESVAYDNMLDVYQGAPVSVVADSWDIYNACKEMFGHKLKDKINARRYPLVVRSDSGDPVKVTLKVIELLGEQFGHDINDKGYKVLPSQVRIIQGDGMTVQNIKKVLDSYKKNNWSGDNIVFGMGGNLLQNVNRDTYNFAIKCSSMNDGSKDIDVYKEPVTDKDKNSKRGKLKLIQDEAGKYKTVPMNAEGQDKLITYYDNGVVHLENFYDVRNRARDFQ